MMPFRFNKWFLLHLFATLILSSKLCQSKLQQLDPNIPYIEGMDRFGELTTHPLELEKDFKQASSASPTLSLALLRRVAARALDVQTIDPLELLITTTTETTPMIYFPGSLSYEQECSVYGEDIESVQKSADILESKLKKLRGDETVIIFGTKVCNWPKARLECIPNQGKNPITTKAPINPGVNQQGQRVKGKCKCLLAMGEKAVWVKDEDDPKLSKCCIPANMGYHSECDYDILLPYGEIDETVRVRRNVASAGSMCVPNSDCDIGYTYTGKRCKCRKGTKPNRADGTCSKGRRFATSYGLVPFLLGTLVMFK